MSKGIKIRFITVDGHFYGVLKTEVNRSLDTRVPSERRHCLLSVFLFFFPFLFFSFLFHLSFFSRHRFNPILFSFENVNQRECNPRETNSISALHKSVGLQLRRQILRDYFNCDFAKSWLQDWIPVNQVA